MSVLIVGGGFIGREFGRVLGTRRVTATLASRHRPAGWDGGWVCVDATQPGAIAAASRATEAETVVLVHGPSDITWCEENPERVMATHVGICTHLCREAPNARKLLISTDNVFDGREPWYDESHVPTPANAYGRAKLAAEAVLQAADPSALIVRLSLVYGYEPPDPARGWRNFFMVVADALRRHRPIRAPVDHWNTPILVDDAAALLARLALGRRAGMLHLAGPDRVSRYEWARLIARGLGLDPSLVAPSSRAEGRYACRPANACLRSLHLQSLPELAGMRVDGVAAGAARLSLSLTQAPSPTGDPPHEP